MGAAAATAVIAGFFVFIFDRKVPVSLRNMIGRSFAAEDAHDQIRAAVVDLFEVLELDATTDVTEVCATTVVFGPYERPASRGRAALSNVARAREMPLWPAQLQLIECEWSRPAFGVVLFECWRLLSSSTLIVEMTLNPARTDTW